MDALVVEAAAVATAQVYAQLLVTEIVGRHVM